MSSPLELLYYNRDKLSFVDEDKENNIIYLCTKEKTPEETIKKAEKANQMYTDEMEVIVREFSDGLMQEIEDEDEESDFSIMDSISLTWDLQKKTEVLVKKIEKEYHCLLIDIIEID